MYNHGHKRHNFSTARSGHIYLQNWLIYSFHFSLPPYKTLNEDIAGNYNSCTVSFFICFDFKKDTVLFFTYQRWPTMWYVLTLILHTLSTYQMVIKCYFNKQLFTLLWCSVGNPERWWFTKWPVLSKTRMFGLRILFVYQSFD